MHIHSEYICRALHSCILCVGVHVQVYPVYACVHKAQDLIAYRAAAQVACQRECTCPFRGDLIQSGLVLADVHKQFACVHFLADR